ncbi:MAG: hypothetical protein LBV74_15675 [Tannerella sp.]|jgi:hypothetical protein|nr:hypothetical protein [Tannerella sp.]
MRKIINTQPSVIYFRRWSRKRYAAFCSIGRCVSIRKVNKSVIEASLMKQSPSLAISLRKVTDTPDIQEKEEEPDLPPSLLLLLSMLIQPQTITKVCGSTFFTVNKPDKKIAGQIYDCICPAFYLYHKKQSIHD